MRILLLGICCAVLCTSNAWAVNHWLKKADFGNFGRHRAAGMAIGNKVYAGTGHLNGDGSDEWYADWWEYDPGTNAWAQRADYPGNGGAGDQDIVAVSFGDVGFAGMGQLSGYTEFYKFDPIQNLWTQVASPPGGSFNNTFPFRIGGYAYFPSLYSTTLYRYDPVNDLWTTLNPLPFSVPYGTPTCTVEGKGYIKNDAAFYEYDPSTDVWTSKPNFPGTYIFRPHMVDQGGCAYVVGGAQSSFNNWGTEVWRYHPSTETWEQMHEFPGTARRWAVLVNLHEHIYYGLGTNGTNFNDWWEYQPTLSLEEEEMTFDIYPNPAAENIHVTVKTGGNYTATITDGAGRVVYSQALNFTSGSQKSNLNISSIAAGNYILTLTGENTATSQQIVIQ